MKNEFFKLWVNYLADGKEVSYEIYLADMDHVKSKLEDLSKLSGRVWGMVSRYEDMGECYLLDLRFGENGFISYEATYTPTISWKSKVGK